MRIRRGKEKIVALVSFSGAASDFVSHLLDTLSMTSMRVCVIDGIQFRMPPYYLVRAFFIDGKRVERRIW